jgi:peptide/nickel transport system substrate-binding protein
LTFLRGSVIAALALALGAAGCGGDGGSGGPATARPAQALSYAIASPPGSGDPLGAASRDARTVSAQIHEPLVETLSGPFGDTRRRRGLAASWSSSADRAVWRFRLRSGIVFQDGEPFNAGAVVENARRWRRSQSGRRILPGLQGADAPTPRLVRFVLGRGDPGFPARLADVRLGIVSPATLERGRYAPARTGGSGTGPFALRLRRGERVVLARNPDWWGTRMGLGPALDQLDFRVVGDEAARLTLLRRGEVQVADELTAGALGLVNDDPLLAALRTGPGRGLGYERSVRGLPAQPHGFGGVWLTRVGQE